MNRMCIMCSNRVLSVSRKHSAQAGAMRGATWHALFVLRFCCADGADTSLSRAAHQRLDCMVGSRLGRRL